MNTHRSSLRTLMTAVLVVALEMTLIVSLGRLLDRRDPARGYVDAFALSVALHVYLIGPVCFLLFHRDPI